MMYFCQFHELCSPKNQKTRMESVSFVPYESFHYNFRKQLVSSLRPKCKLLEGKRSGGQQRRRPSAHIPSVGDDFHVLAMNKLGDDGQCMQ